VHTEGRAARAGRGGAAAVGAGGDLAGARRRRRGGALPRADRAPRRRGGAAARLARSYPTGGGLLLSLARLHEAENLALLGRAARRGLPLERWRALWRPLGAAATIGRAAAEEARSPADLARLVARTPWAEAGDVLAGADGAAAELSLERLASRRIVDEAAALPGREAAARSLALDLVRERDLAVVCGARARGLDGSAVAAATALLAFEPGAERLHELASWTDARGPLGPLLPPSVLGREPSIADWDALALRRRRRRACGTAFLGPPLRLAPAVAALLLLDEEARALAALAEPATDGEAAGALERALAGSALGDRASWGAG